MLKKFRNTIHIKLDREEIKEIREKSQEQPTPFITVFEYMTNDVDYDIIPMGDFYYLSNYCIGYDCLVNGGEYAISINSYQVDKLLSGKTVIFKQFDYKYIENEDYEIELINS